jgi:Uma2 family endonuclease
VNTSTLPEPAQKDAHQEFVDSLFPRVELIADDGVPMESEWQVRETSLLIDSVDHHYEGRDDYYVGGNMFVYFSEKQARDKDFRGPDFFFVKDAKRFPIREYWCSWLEDGKLPDAIIELISKSTRDVDYGEKKLIYERVMRVGDYFCYDPDTETLDGWRRQSGKFKPLRPNSEGRLWSEEMQMWLGTWKGKFGPFDLTWLRFFDKNGNLVLTRAEAEAKRADEQAKRADAAEAELARLRDQMKVKNGKQNGGNGQRKKK